MSHGRVSDSTTNRWFLLRTPVRVLWIIYENIIGPLFYVCAMIICRPLSWIAPRLYWRLDEWMVWMGMYYVSSWMTPGIGKLMIYGDELDPYVNQPCLLLINHQSDLDPLILMAAWRHLERLQGKISVVLEDIFQWTHFGIMMRIRGDFFIHQGRDQRHLQPALIEEHIRKYEHAREPRWYALFPEGGFLQKRKQRNIDYAKKNGYPVLENVLLPRLGAAQALLNAMPHHPEVSKNHSDQNGDTFQHQPKRYFRHVIDVTLAYHDRKPFTLIDMLLAISPVPQVAVHFRVRKITNDDCVSNDERLRKFLYDMWTEKDALLERYYETGSFPDFRREDHLPVNYMKYVKGYALALPVLTLVGFCIWMCLTYAYVFLTWLLYPLISWIL